MERFFFKQCVLEITISMLKPGYPYHILLETRSSHLELIEEENAARQIHCAVHDLDVEDHCVVVEQSFTRETFAEGN